ncbi:ribonuclease H-like protein [Cryphonectria parasitica EP155]|uniref:Ribonuclease H-like protein n=1 Tax=Cryphonectria parasitica (strain ATCC 38755 / EP155) TaxID=660469 RepID=A0A9P4YDB7_CRYP1|nr:ribonuclease H-like protein [Cryphonectria parasitica EP155]KAF3770894.1 ribonuclease H-like protein [Cryphonectria parasitica EP155]
MPTPFTPLDYKMSDEVFQAARQAAEGTDESFWSYSFYRGPNREDGVKGKVRVHYCKNAHVAERALQYLVGEKFVGLDLEWVALASKSSGARRNVSLVQLASQSRVVLLHLAVYPAKDELATPTLRKIIEDPNVTKLGVWIKGDCTRLKKYLSINARGIFELSHLFKQVKYSTSRPALVNKKLVSLATQCKEVFGLPMRKDQNVRTSDWSQPLDMGQIGYSASDAYAAIHLFAMLNHQREKLDPVPALPFHLELDKPIPLPPGVEMSSSEESDLDEGITDEALLEAEDSVTSNTNTKKAATKSRATTATKAMPAPELPKDPKVEAAEICVAEHKEARGGKIRVTPAALKAYFIWHANKGLNCEDVARMLRDPPLQTSTVASYILSSVQSEKLPYDNERMKTEVAGHMHDSVIRSRFFGIWKAIHYGVASSKE